MSKNVNVQAVTLPGFKNREYPKNPRLMFLKSNTLSPSAQRKRRRVKSRIVNKSRNFSLTCADGILSLTDFPRSGDLEKVKPDGKPINESREHLMLDLGAMLESNKSSRQSDSISDLRKEINNIEKLSIGDSDYGTTMLVLPSESGLGVKIGAFTGTSSEVSDISHKTIVESNYREVGSTSFPHAAFLERSSYSVDYKQEPLSKATEIICTDEDDETLPPYYQIIPEMFYRFAGISEYSNSNILQSKGDFEKLLKCLDMDSLLEEFLIWFPKPKLVKPGIGYISLDMFCDLFSSKFAQTILESRWQYETLCSAILTMKCLDQKKMNRVEFQEFLQLYQSLHPNGMKTENISNVFKKYDSNGIGLLTIENIFKFCCDEETAEE